MCSSGTVGSARISNLYNSIGMDGRIELYEFLTGNHDTPTRTSFEITRDDVTRGQTVIDAEGLSEDLPLYYRILCEYTFIITIDLLFGTPPLGYLYGSQIGFRKHSRHVHGIPESAMDSVGGAQ